MEQAPRITAAIRKDADADFGVVADAAQVGESDTADGCGLVSGSEPLHVFKIAVVQGYLRSESWVLVDVADQDVIGRRIQGVACTSSESGPSPAWLVAMTLTTYSVPLSRSGMV